MKIGHIIFTNGDICDCTCNSEKYLQAVYKHGNWFPTLELAEEEIKYRAISQELKMWANKCEPCDWEDVKQEKHHLYYSYQVKQIEIETDWYCRYKTNDIYFSNKEVLEQALESIGQDRLIREYFRVK